ncbi:MAG: hypothetical protein ACLSWI_02905 [Candidatus Gastranaerophilaceae bacterium]
MPDYIEYKIENNNILSSIDSSIKKARELELGNCPYAVVVHPECSKNLKLENLTYLPKDGFKSIPIIKHSNVSTNSFKLAYNEESLIEIIRCKN